MGRKKEETLVFPPETQMSQLIDTNVFIEYFRGNRKADQYLHRLDTLRCSVITAAELIQGARSHKELKSIKQFIEKLEVFPLTPMIGSKMLALMISYHRSRGLQIPDALIAATAIEEKLTLVTGNTKHFSFIKDLEILEWKKISASFQTS